MIDYNAYVGRWPFYSLPYYDVDNLIRLYKQYGVDGGYVSSIDSIFYNDFYESELALSEMLKGTHLHHVVTPNPAFVECPITLERCIREFDVRGIRIHPEYHGFKLTDECLKPMLDVARRNKLPIFVTARMHDERVSHMIHPRALELDELKSFASENADLKIILCGLKVPEVEALTEVLMENPNLFSDTSSLRNNLYGNSKTEHFKKSVYGSGYPLLHVSMGTFMLSELEGEARDIFFSRGDVLL